MTFELSKALNIGEFIHFSKTNKYYKIEKVEKIGKFFEHNCPNEATEEEIAKIVAIEEEIARILNTRILTKVR